MPNRSLGTCPKTCACRSRTLTASQHCMQSPTAHKHCSAVMHEQDMLVSTVCCIQTEA